jgi:heme a synthase
MPPNVLHQESPWPQRWAVALACATFPLLWVGGLVTTTDAGLAVPDWPTTYGYNLFLYPLGTWLAGPWDIFVEHGHRLLGAAVGMLTIGLLVVILSRSDRRSMRWLSIAALGLVVFQGVLGGMRVVLNERTLAMLHGCVGPLFFGLTVALAVFSSKRWRMGASGSASALDDTEKHWQSQWHTSVSQAGHIRRLAVVTCILVYLQIVLGAVLRHVPVATEPATFALAVKFHLFMAAVLVLHVTVLTWSVLRHASHVPMLRLLSLALASLVALQLVLGAATWLVKYSVPYWASGWLSLPIGSITSGGPLQTHIVTAHVAAGSLLLAASLTLALYSMKLLSAPAAALSSTAPRMEVAV